MFAALTVVRLREAVTEAKLNSTKSWVSPDDVKAVNLPLAKAAEKVLGSMHTILTKTKQARDKELDGMSGPLGIMEKEKDSEKRTWLRKTKAAEVRIVRCLSDLREPSLQWKAQTWDIANEGTNEEDCGLGQKPVEGDAQGGGLGMQSQIGPATGHRRIQSETDSTLPHRRG